MVNNKYGEINANLSLNIEVAPVIRSVPTRLGPINYIDIKAKCRHLKKLTCKETLRQVFITVYRLEIQSVMLVFSTQLRELLPL